jgi:dihydrofolate reductase
VRRIVYYVAASLDGYICGSNNSIEGFVSGGNGVERYLGDLTSFDTVIMGRNTYEFGYGFGLKPGQPAYPNMFNYVVSSGLKFENQHEHLRIFKLSLDEILRIKKQEGTDIYLCGGGELAGWLLDHEQIDILKLKLNPLIIGQGVRLFGSSQKKYLTELIDTQLYDGGLQIMAYKIRY